MTANATERAEQSKQPTDAEAITFPSVAWFRALADEAAADEARYRRLGVTEITLALRVGAEGFRLVFVDFGCADVSSWDGTAPVDCVIAASAEDWRELVEHIRERGNADAYHTLNSLVLAGDRFHLEGDEQLGVDAFYRFNATLQAYIEEAAKVPTVFAGAT
ncbi:MAG: hypothetical protein U0V73_01970 [Acidimicrobiia bacterium]